MTRGNNHLSVSVVNQLYQHFAVRCHFRGVKQALPHLESQPHCLTANMHIHALVAYVLLLIVSKGIDEGYGTFDPPLKMHQHDGDTVKDGW